MYNFDHTALSRRGIVRVVNHYEVNVALVLFASADCVADPSVALAGHIPETLRGEIPQVEESAEDGDLGEVRGELARGPGVRHGLIAGGIDRTEKNWVII